MRYCPVIELGTLVLVTLAAGGFERATAQNLALEGRAPRFLFAENREAAPRPIEVRNVRVLSERVSVDLDGATLADALAAITQQTGLKFVYSPDVVPADARVRLRAQDITVAAALTEILLDTGVDVLLSPGAQAALVKRAEAVQGGTVSGRVTDAKTGKAITNVSVFLAGTRWRTTTGEDGAYHLLEVAPGTYTLSASRIGYGKQNESVTVVAGQELTVDLSLRVAATELEQVVVTGTVAPTERKAIPTPISVITADQIEQRGYERLDQIFRGDVPGIIAYDQGTRDGSTAIYIRGTTNTETGSAAPGSNPKVYIDGVEVADPYVLSAIDPATVDHVELVRGPEASTLYGSQALSGVLQVFTKKGTRNQTQPQLDLKADYGSVESQWVSSRSPQTDVSGSIQGGTQDLSYNVQGSHLHTGEYARYYNSDRTTFVSSISGSLGLVDVAFSARFANRRNHEPYFRYQQVLVDQGVSSAKPSDTDHFERSVGFGSNFVYTPSAAWKLNLTLGYDRWQAGFVQNTTRLTTPSDTLLFFNNFDEQKVTTAVSGSGSWQVSQATSANLVFGADYWTSNFGDIGSASNTNRGSIGGALYWEDRDVGWNVGYFGQGQFGIKERLFFTAGIRIDKNPNIGSDYGFDGQAVAPRVGVSFVHDLADDLTLKARASYGKAIRPPTYQETFGSNSPYAVFLANSQIAPEAQIGGDLGVELYYGKRASFEATYYNQRVLDLIDGVLLQSATAPYTYQFQNVGRINNTGWEFGARWSQGPLDLNGTFSITSSVVKKLSPTYTGDLQVNDRMLFVPEHSGGLNLQYKHGRGYVSAGLTYVGAVRGDDWIALFQYFYGVQPYRGSFRNYWITYPGFAKYNGGAGFDITHNLRGFLKVENLLNSTAIEQNNFFMPRGRVTTLGLRLKT